jgi:cell division protein FtsQ
MLGCSVLRKNKRKIKIKKQKFVKIKKKKMSKKFWKIIFLMIILFVCLILLMISPFFCIRSIDINGVVLTNENSLLESTQIKIGDNWYTQTGLRKKDWFFKSHSQVEEQLVKSFPYIAQAHVSLTPIGKLVIEVSERQPKFLMLHEERYWIINENGILLEIVDPISRPNLPILENLQIETHFLGERIDFKEAYLMEKVEQYLNLVKKLQERSKDHLLQKVTSLDFSRMDSFSFVLDNRIRVILLGVEDLTPYKINFIEEIFYNKLDTKAKGTLDFSRDFSEAVFSPS